MSWAVNGLLRNSEFLHLPGVSTAAVVGVTSTAMAIGLHILGFPYNENVVTALFAIAGASGTLITVIAAIAYPILARAREWLAVRGFDAEFPI